MLLFVTLEEHADGIAADKAVVSLAPATARLFLERQDRVLAQKQLDMSLYAHEFFDRGCTIFSADELRDILASSAETDPGAAAVLAVLDQDDDIAAAADDPGVSAALESLNSPDLDCHSVIVTDTDFTWTAPVKNGSQSVRTVAIPRAWFEQAAQAVMGSGN
jgi:hypothetical protein